LSLKNNVKSKKEMDLSLKDIFIGELNVSFILEIIIRTFIMFLMVLIILRLSGKKGVRQLSLFEVAIIIALGSAAGDPMFNKDTPLLPSVIVFAVIIIVYRIITYFASRHEKFEDLVEGEPLYVIEEGQFALGIKNDHTFAKDEFFAEMRQESIEHVGQVKTAILETTGNVSFYYFENEDVKYGLPVLPKLYGKKSDEIKNEDMYACTYCGNATYLVSGKHQCKRCGNREWVKALNSLRNN